MRRANQFMSKGNNHSLPFYGGKRKHDERLVPVQFLIARLGRSSTTYRQAIYVQRLLPASLPSGSHVTTGALSGAICQAGGITSGLPVIRQESGHFIWHM